jgi:hypothetical protein
MREIKKQQDQITMIQPEAKKEIVRKTRKTEAIRNDITHAKDQQIAKHSGRQDTITGQTLGRAYRNRGTIKKSRATSTHNQQNKSR